MEENMVGRGREAIEMIVDAESFQENLVGNQTVDGEFGPGAVVGTAQLNGEPVTVIANDAQAMNPRFPVVYFGVIGMEEAYKMANAVYLTMEADAEKPVEQKRPLVLIVDTPGNGPGKVEEIMGMNKATGAYQLALAEARKAGHPIVAMVIGRAISGAFLCHGLQADHILALPKECGTVIHVMPLSSISRITKMDIESLNELSQRSPVFASGVDFFYRLGGVEEIVPGPQEMRNSIAKHIGEIRTLKTQGKFDQTGPWGRGTLGAEREGRTTRKAVIEHIAAQFQPMADRYLL
ncbi:biotin-independent malonate decarboxylase subunit gamma [Candidatus Avoscillospira sp. LCP25S3_F1]|uniref:biotin-independent malonate decarboxylase subunit gamma n=1 Tax=Candidatus Avoscillospira sp. LCP25S3_F1 TaxID=3438825 RepID=UPI003F91F787